MLKNHYNFLLLAGCLSLSYLSRAQESVTDHLAKGIQSYNQIKTVVAAPSGTLAEIDAVNLDNYYKNGKTQLDSALLMVPDSQKIAVRYFLANLGKSYADGLMLKNDTTRALSVLQALDSTFNEFSSDHFPFEYQTNNLYHIVRWSDFESVICQYNAALGTLYFNDKQYDKALEYVRKANDPVCLEPEAFIWNTYRLVTIKKEKNEDDSELLDAALALFASWNLLDDDTKNSTVTLQSIPVLCADAIEKILVENPSLSNDGEVWARSSRLLTDERMENRAVNFAVNAIKNGLKDKEFLLSLFPQAQQTGNKIAAKLAADEYAALTVDSNCTELQLAADQYEQLGESSLAKKFRDKAGACSKSYAKMTRVSARDGGLYLGTYVAPWFRSDWGVVGAIHSRKWLMEVSYQSLDDRRDKMYDIRIRGVDGAADARARWDGYYTHLAISKLGGKKGGHSYSGLLFGYNLREYQPIYVQSITNEQGDQINSGGDVTFNAKEERYILMTNNGFHSYGRFFASDFFFSIGGAWTRFERGNAGFDNDNYTYSHPLIDGRRSSRVALMVRVGMTIGLEIGNKTFEKKSKKKSHS